MRAGGSPGFTTSTPTVAVASSPATSGSRHQWTPEQDAHLRTLGGRHYSGKGPFKDRGGWKGLLDELVAMSGGKIQLNAESLGKRWGKKYKSDHLAAVPAAVAAAAAAIQPLIVAKTKAPPSSSGDPTAPTTTTTTTVCSLNSSKRPWHNCGSHHHHPSA